MRKLVSILFTFVLINVGCEKDTKNALQEGSKNETCQFVNLFDRIPLPISNSYIFQLDESKIILPQGDENKHKAIHSFLSFHLSEWIANGELNVTHIYSSVFPGFAAEMQESTYKIVKQLPIIQFAEKDIPVSVFSDCEEGEEPSTGSETLSTGAQRVGTANGTGKTAWVLDTGIDPNHADLNVDSDRSRDFTAGISLIPDLGIFTTAKWQDDHGHGTHVAGIIGAKKNGIGVRGVAYNCNLVAIKVLDENGDGNSSDVIEGLDYVTANGAVGDVANLSLGGGASTLLDEAVRRTAAMGVFLALAAGNERSDANSKSPARVNGEGIYTISSFGSGDRFSSFFSNYGNPPIDYSQPGENILSTWPGNMYKRASGTSMATPHLAGLLLINGKNFATDGTVNGDVDETPDLIAVQPLNIAHTSIP